MPNGYKKNSKGVSIKKKLGGSTKPKSCGANHFSRKNCRVCNYYYGKKHRLGSFSQKERNRIMVI